MSIQIKLSVVAMAITVIISGCSTTKNVATIELDQGKIVEYTIPAAIIGDTDSASKINSAYTDALKRATAYRAVYRQDNISSGVRVTPLESSVRVAYVHQNDGGSLKNDFIADFMLGIIRSGNNYTAKITCPSSISNDSSSLTGLPWSEFISKEKVIADVNALCRKGELTFPVTENGEINTSFNDSSVFANFARKFKSYSPKIDEVKQYDLEKSKWFYVQDNAKEHKVAISVFPYRNGSKVVYRSVRTVTCKPNQTCTDFDPAFTQRLRTVLTNIAND